jgi:hypothetical protein
MHGGVTLPVVGPRFRSVTHMADLNHWRRRRKPLFRTGRPASLRCVRASQSPRAGPWRARTRRRLGPWGPIEPVANVCRASACGEILPISRCLGVPQSRDTAERSVAIMKQSTPSCRASSELQASLSMPASTPWWVRPSAASATGMPPPPAAITSAPRSINHRIGSSPKMRFGSGEATKRPKPVPSGPTVQCRCRARSPACASVYIGPIGLLGFAKAGSRRSTSTRVSTFAPAPTQHGRHRKRRETLLAFGRERGNQRHQFSPRHHPVHLVQELALARSLGRQVQAQVSLLHGSRRRSSLAFDEARIGPSYADHP